MPDSAGTSPDHVDSFADFIASVPTHAYDTPFGRSSYWEMGSGEPLVLLHGISGGRRLFFRVVPLLAQRYRVIVPLLRGEELPARGFSVDDLLDDVGALLDALALENVTLYGASFGGYVALAYGGRLDARVRAVVVQGAFPQFQLGALDRVALYGSYLLPPRLGSDYYAWRVLQGRESRYLREFTPGLAELNFGWQRATPFVSLRQRTHLIARVDLANAVKRIEASLRIGHAVRDPVVPMSAFTRLRKLRPDAHFEEWELGGHMQMLTHPDQFAGLA